MQEIFYNFFSDWLQGMVLVIMIFHLSTYLFTKDKSFLYYSIYLFIISVFLINIIDNPISNIIRRPFKNILEASFWLTPVWFWMFLTMFFLEFLDVKKEYSRLYKTTLLYVKTNLIFFTSVWLIDFLFLSSAYYFKYCVNLFLIVGILFCVYALIKIRKIKNELFPLFIFGFFIALFISINFHISGHIFPNNILNEFLNYKTVFVVGFSIKMVVLSIALNYKYELFRVQKEKLNKLLIEELKINEKLKDEANKSLHEKMKDIIIELDLVAEKAQENKLAQVEAKFKNEINQLKLSSLLSHINSHFVFNALNSIKLFIINKQHKKAAFYLTKFSKLIRKILEASTSTKTTLTDELKTMRLYTSIESIRFDESIKFKFKIDETIDIDKIYVPPLILHPFIENAIWHGVSSLKGEKRVGVFIQNEEEFIIIKIQDNGVGFKVASQIEKTKTIKRTSFGIKSTRERLDNYYKSYKKKYFLLFTDLTDIKNAKTGTLVTLKIPKK